jgi:hypothetical protein
VLVWRNGICSKEHCPSEIGEGPSVAIHLTINISIAVTSANGNGRDEIVCSRRQPAGCRFFGGPYSYKFLFRKRPVLLLKSTRSCAKCIKEKRSFPESRHALCPSLPLARELETRIDGNNASSWWAHKNNPKKYFPDLTSLVLSIWKDKLLVILHMHNSGHDIYCCLDGEMNNLHDDIHKRRRHVVSRANTVYDRSNETLIFFVAQFLYLAIISVVIIR